MSDTVTPLRIRAQSSPRDPDTLRFLLDAPVRNGAGSATFDGTTDGTTGEAPLARALFALNGVRRVEVDGACIHVRKSTDARWEDLKAPIAAAIRAVLASTGEPLGARPDGTDRDAQMLAAIRDLLDRRINPSIAGHGGHIGVERVTDRVVHLRMSGGCQGCAASQLTLRGGVERTLRAALPDVQTIVDVTGHDAGTEPFYWRVTDRAGPVTSPIAGPAPGAPPSGASVDAPWDGDPPLARRVRRYLEALPSSAPAVSYGALTRALGLWRPGSVRRITRALEDTMREDARAGRAKTNPSVPSTPGKSKAWNGRIDDPTNTRPISAECLPRNHTWHQQKGPTMQLHLSNDRTEVDMRLLAGAFGFSREALDDALSLGTISYWYELGPGDTATPRTVFRSTETGQRVTLDRTGRIMSAEESHLVDQPAPCSETCRPVGAKERAVDAATPVDATCASGQSRQQAAARRLDGLLDQALQDTFPASDPVAISFDAPRPGP